jgi:kynurenine formamidase
MGFPADVAELAARVRNWGRWGDDDRVGTLNLIDSTAVRRGVASAIAGRPISLAMPLSKDGPQLGFVDGRTNPVLTSFTFSGGTNLDASFLWHDDRIELGVQAATHWDGLGHASYGGHFYNGYPATDQTCDTESAVAHLGIEHVRTVVTRGVLLDVAATRGVDRLGSSTVVTPDDLDAAAELARTRVEPGDVVLVRTGHIRNFHDGDVVTYATTAPGPGLAAVEWFHRHDVAAVATDNLIFEVFPSERADASLPVHFLHLVDMGLTQGQNFDLEALADDCAGDGRYAFLLCASPEPFVGAAGAPVNPVAVK